jgi:glycosyltransferase involved in cell wall biosynthesis
VGAAPGDGLMRVAMIVQQVDTGDWLRAFIVPWIRALAARVERLDVITLERGLAELPDNVAVYSMGKERGYSRPRELVEFYRALGSVVRDVDVIFSHMTPRYAWLSAPLAMINRQPQILWYTHRHIDLELRLATAVCRYIATAAPESFPLRTGKVRALGHGIDSEYFSPDPRCVPDNPPLVVHVARIMPIKHQDALLRAVAALPGVHAALVGAVPTGQDAAYLTRLQDLARDLDIQDRVTFTGGLLAGAVRDLYRRATVAVNLSPSGLFDKAALESMLTGTPTIVSSPAFDTLLGEYMLRLRIDGPEDVEGLTERLRSLIALSPDERQTMTSSIRKRVKAAHSLDGLMDRLVTLMASTR